MTFCSFKSAYERKGGQIGVIKGVVKGYLGVALSFKSNDDGCNKHDTLYYKMIGGPQMTFFPSIDRQTL